MTFFIYLLINLGLALVGAMISSWLGLHQPDLPAQPYIPPDVTPGTMIPLAAGTVRARPIMVLLGKVETQPVKAQTGSAFFGLIPQYATIGNRYFITAMSVLCHGAIVALQNVVFGDTQPLTDLPPTSFDIDVTVHEGFLGFGTTVDTTVTAEPRMSGGITGFTEVLHHGQELLTFYLPTVFGGEVVGGGGGVFGSIRIYTGGGANVANGHLQGIVGAGNLPSYRELGYIVFEGTNIGMRPTVPPIDFIIDVHPFRDPGSGHANLNIDSSINARTIISRSALSFITFGSAATWQTGDANPIACALLLLTHRMGGLARPVAEIDLHNWDDAAATVKSDGLGCSFITQGTRQSVKDRLTELFSIANAVPRRDPQSNLLQIKLIRAEDPSTMRVIDSTMIVEADLSQRQLGDTFNEVTLFFSNADLLFDQDFVTVRDRGNVAATGSIRPMNAIRMPSVTLYSEALQIAIRELKAVSLTPFSGTINVTREAFDVERGDVCLYDIPWLGFDDAAGHYGRIALRTTAVNLGSPKSNAVTLTVTQDLFALADPVVDVVDTPTQAPLGAPTFRPPQIIPTQRDDGITGWLDLVVIDPDTTVISVTMSELVGGASAPSAFHAITGIANVYEDSVALSVTGQSSIAYKVLYGDQQTIAGSVLFPVRRPRIELTFTDDGNGHVIATGSCCFRTIGYEGTIVGWQLNTRQAAAITFDLWRNNGGTTMPTIADSLGLGFGTISDVEIANGTLAVPVHDGDNLVLNILTNDISEYFELTLFIDKTG